MSDHLCLSPLSTADNYFPLQPSADNFGALSRCRHSSSCYLREKEKKDRKRGRKKKRATTAGLDFSSCTFHSHRYECDDGSGVLTGWKWPQTLWAEASLHQLYLLYFTRPDQATQNYPTFILIFVILYLSQGHQGEDHKAISISTRQGKHLACNAQI